MKKRTSLLAGILFSLVLTISFPHVGESADVKFSILGFHPATSLQLRASLIARALLKEYPNWDVKAKAAVRAVVEHYEKRLNHEVDLFITLNPWENELLVREEIYPDIDFRKDAVYLALMPTNKKTLHFYVREETGITSPKDIVNSKKIYRIGFTYSHYPLLSGIMEAYGETWEQMKKRGYKYVDVNCGSRTGAQKLAKGALDMCFAWSGVPNPPIQEAGSSAAIRLLPLNDQAIKNVEHLGFYKHSIPAGAYSFNDSEIPSVAQTEYLAAGPDKISDDVAYLIVKGLWSQRNFLNSNFGAFREVFDPEFIKVSLKKQESTGVTIHPGAVRFYREKGWYR